MGRRSREPDQAEWLRNIQQQPENVARLLVFESRFGGLRVDEHDYVWSGGGTSFKLIPQETQSVGQTKWTTEPAEYISTTTRPAHRKRA